MENYLLMIEELNNEPVENENPTLFNMNNVVDNAKSGDTALIEQLYQASKIKVYEYYVGTGKKHFNPNEDRFIKYSICTPKRGRNVTKENIERIFPTHDKLVEYLVEFHNNNAEETSKPQLSLEELNTLYQATQEQTM